jgi:hypothetical protein
MTIFGLGTAIPWSLEKRVPSIQLFTIFYWCNCKKWIFRLDLRLSTVPVLPCYRIHLSRISTILMFVQKSNV